MKDPILIVDDDPSVTAALAVLLQARGFATLEAASPREALEALERRSVGLVLQDMNFSSASTGEEGLELLRSIRSLRPALPVILMTAWGSIQLAVEGMKTGAADFITKPWSNERLLASLETTLALATGSSEPPVPGREELDERWDFTGLVGRHPRLLKVLEMAGRVAGTDASVLVTGESGTGKELLAEAIHRNSRRCDGPFVKVNLGGISSTLFESEMFGHVRGAFTDAQRDRQGRFARADGGTIFLDEIGEVDPASQVKLLRVLQDRTYEVLGSSATRRVDVRVVSATNRDLGRMTAAGSFREDLLYRLNLITLELPPLRDRPSDIPLLARHFVARVAEAYGREPVTLTEAAVAWLRERPWPGNVRQLRQGIERAVLVGRSAESGRIGREELIELEELSSGAPERPALPPAGAMTLEEMERAMVVRALAAAGGNVAGAARALGLSRAALYRRCEKYGVDPRASDP